MWKDDKKRNKSTSPIIHHPCSDSPSSVPISVLLIWFWRRAAMAAWLRACLQLTLKIVNSVIGLVGMAMILCSLWMIRAWLRQMNNLSQDLSGSSPSWFIYTFLAMGIFLCVIMCSGHIAAETINGHCLFCFMLLGWCIPPREVRARILPAVIFFLLMLEVGITADIFLNRNWEEDFSHDPLGKFNQFEYFVRSNSVMCKWIGLLVVAAEVLSIFLAMILRALGPDPGVYDDSDDDTVPATLPLLRNQPQSTPYLANPNFSVINDSWNVKIHDKVRRW